MPFSFLNPWLLLGALALAAPLWLHLRRRQEKNILRFSALRFLDDEPQPRQSPLRLRNLLLFLLRTLALLFVVGAFAWPFLRNKDTMPIDHSRVYIFDNTLSHQAASQFKHDRDALLSEINKAGPNIQVALVELASSPRVVVAFSDSRDTARERIGALEPSFERGSYLAAFRTANSLLAKSFGAKKRIIFLGDNQRNQWEENASSPPFLRGVQVDLPTPTEIALPNLSVSDPRVQRVFLGDKSLVNFTAKLTHSGPAKAANVILRADGQVIFNRTIDLDKQSETILLQGQWEAAPGAWLRGLLSVEGAPDALPADNQLFFSLPPVVEGKVAVLAQSPYLRLALSPDIMRGQWAAHLIEPSRIADELSSNNDAEVLCIESNFLQSGDARKLLWRYLSNGRGVVLFVNRVTPAITGFLRELGFEAEPASDPGTKSAEKFQFVLSNHPIFHPFLSPDYGNLLDIKVYPHARLRSAQALPLIFSDRGEELFFQSTKSQGRLFVMAFGLDREQTSWPVHQTFIPFLDLTLQTARAEDPTPLAFEPAQAAVLQLPALAAAREVVLRSEQRELGRFPVEQGRARLQLPATPGLYDLTIDENTKAEKVFSVNPSPKESELAFEAAPPVLQTWQFNARQPARSAAITPVKPSRAAILQQRLWWWMLVTGLVCLLLETALAQGIKLKPTA
jgi:hypothetical protein